MKHNILIMCMMLITCTLLRANDFYGIATGDPHPDPFHYGNTITSTLNSTTDVTAMSSTSGLTIGEPVVGTGIPAGDTISVINSSTEIHLTLAATVTATEPLTFANGWKQISSSGSGWVRFDINWNTFETGTAGVYSLNSEKANFLSLAQAAGLKVVAIVGAGPFNSPVTGTLNSTTDVTATSTGGMRVGDAVVGTGIPSGDTVSTIDSSTEFHLATAATVSATESLAVGSTRSPTEYANPYDITGYKNACAWLAQNTSVSAIEVLNEPNNTLKNAGTFLGGIDWRNYLVNLTNGTADAVHAVSTDPVIGLGIQGDDVVYCLAQTLSANLAGVVYHPYDAGGNENFPEVCYEPTTLLTNLGGGAVDYELWVGLVKTKIAASNNTGLKIWETEFAEDNGNDSYVRTVWLMRRMLMSAHNGVLHAFPYGWIFNACNNQQMVDWNGQDPRLPYYAFKRLYNTNNGVLNGAISASGTVTVTGGDTNTKTELFTNSTQTLCGIWEGYNSIAYVTKTDVPVTVSFPTTLTNGSGSYVLNMATGESSSINPSISGGIATINGIDLSSEPNLIVIAPGNAPQQVAVPNVVGLTEAAADTAITNAGLTIGPDQSANSPTVAVGNVISQSPAAGTLVTPGSAVVETISLGPVSTAYQTQTVNYGGSTNQLLTTWSLAQRSGDTIDITFTPSTPTPVVADSSVDTYAQIAPGHFRAINVASHASGGSQTVTWPQQVNNPTMVSVESSGGSSQVSVPNVVGMTEANGDAAILAAGLVIGTDLSVPNTIYPTGVVTAQMPAAGTLVAAGSSVVETISTGAPPPTPFVTGVTTFGALRNTTLNTWVGFSFNVGANPITVKALGRWVISGNSQTHNVELVRASDGSVLATVSVPTSGLPAGAFSYTNLTTPITLSVAGTYYVMSYENTGGDNIYDCPATGTQTTISTTAVATDTNAEWSTSNGTFNVSSGSTSNETYGPVNFTYVMATNTVTVPNVSGMVEANADAAIIAAGLQVGTDVFAASSTVPAGNVISQSPSAGTSVAAGSSVVETISTGPTINIQPFGNVPIGSRTLKWNQDFTVASYSPFTQAANVAQDANTGTAPTSIWFAFPNTGVGPNCTIGKGFGAQSSTGPWYKLCPPGDGDPYSDTGSYLNIHANGNGSPPYGGIMMSANEINGPNPLQVSSGFTAANAYWECKAWFPAGGSYEWPVFWLFGTTLGATSQREGEIDVCEGPENNAGINLHSWPGNIGVQGGLYGVNGVIADGYHVFGCLINSGTIQIYFDGVLQQSFTVDDAWSVPMVTLLQNTYFPGATTGNVPSNDMKVLYVRCWD